MSNVKAQSSKKCQMTKAKLQESWFIYHSGFDIWTLDFIWHLNFDIWI